MNPADQNLVAALLHHVTVVFSSDDPENVAREREIENIKQCTKLAEKLVAGKATEQDRASARYLVHPGVRTDFNL